MASSSWSCTGTGIRTRRETFKKLKPSAADSELQFEFDVDVDFQIEHEDSAAAADDDNGVCAKGQEGFKNTSLYPPLKSEFRNLQGLPTSTTMPRMKPRHMTRPSVRKVVESLEKKVNSGGVGKGVATATGVHVKVKSQEGDRDDDFLTISLDDMLEDIFSPKVKVGTNEKGSKINRTLDPRVSPPPRSRIITKPKASNPRPASKLVPSRSPSPLSRNSPHKEEMNPSQVQPQSDRPSVKNVVQSYERRFGLDTPKKMGQSQVGRGHGEDSEPSDRKSGDQTGTSLSNGGAAAGGSIQSKSNPGNLPSGINPGNKSPEIEIVKQLLNEQKIAMQKDKKLRTKFKRIVAILVEDSDSESKESPSKIQPELVETLPSSAKIEPTPPVSIPVGVKVCPTPPSQPGPSSSRTLRASTGNGTMVKSFVETYERNVAAASKSINDGDGNRVPVPGQEVTATISAGPKLEAPMIRLTQEEIKIKKKFQVSGSTIDVLEDDWDVMYDQFYNMEKGQGSHSLLEGEDNYSCVMNITKFALDFVWLPTPLGFRNLCRVIRSRKGMHLAPTFSLFVAREGFPEVLVLTAKRTSLMGRDYIISTNPGEVSSKSKYCAGTLEYNPQDKTHLLKRPPQTPYPFRFQTSAEMVQNQNGQSQRKEWVPLLAIKFSDEPKTLGGVKQPSRVRVVIPRLESDSKHCNPGCLTFPPNDKDTNKLLIVKNRVPRFNGTTGTYELNFKPTPSRSVKPSVKNFQLAYKNQDLAISDMTLLQFVRSVEDDGTFFLDFGYPFCPLQAFAVALSSLDVK